VNRFVYILIALEHGEVKECFVLSDVNDAVSWKGSLIEIYGGANVVMASRKIDEKPFLVKQ
jgi:hypothetical protein